MNTTRFRTYKISVNFFLISIYSNSKVYEITNGKSTILPGLKYSLLTIVFGWWGFGLPWKAFQKYKNTLTALHINFTGGEDYTKTFTEMDFSEKTIWVYNNLNRDLYTKTNLELIDILIDLYTQYLLSGKEITTEKIIMHLKENLKKINVLHLRTTDLKELITKIEQFEFRATK